MGVSQVRVIMRKISKIFTIVLCFIYCFSCVSFAGSCNSDYYDRAEYFSEIAGQKLMENLGGEQDLRVKMKNCSYNTFSKKFKLNIGVYWNGSIIKSNQYNIDGELKVNYDGSGAEFAETYANQNVKDLRDFALLAGGVIVLGILASESE